ncbi:MAG: O-antigen ligase family protein [Patescibacteria group bacterium]
METRLNKFLRKTNECLIYLFVFILPWQIKLIIQPAETNYSEISLYFSHALLLVILIIFLWLRLKASDHEDDSKLIIYSLAALEVFVFISIFFAPDKLLAFYRYFIFLVALSLFFIVRIGSEQKSYQETLFDKINLVYCLLASVFLHASLGIYQFLTQSTFAFKYLGLADHNPETLGTAVVETLNGRWLRAYGGLDHPNILGGVLAISLILAAYLLAKKKMLNTSKEIWSSIFLFIFYFISLYALFFTFSRSAWLAFAVGLVILLIIFIINKDKWIVGRFIALLFFSAILMIIAIAPFQELLMVRVEAETRLEQKSIKERNSYFVQSRDLLQNNFLSGVGIGNYSSAVALSDNNKKPAWEYQPVHNTFLLLWVEGGFFSFISFLIFLFFLIKNGRREMFAFAILVPLIVLMFLDHWLISLPFGLLFLFLILGLI